MNSVSLKLDDDVHEGLKLIAARSESTHSEIVNDALRLFLQTDASLSQVSAPQGDKA